MRNPMLTSALAGAMTLIAGLPACSPSASSQAPAVQTAQEAGASQPVAAIGAENPFFAPSPLPFETPDFAAITEEHYLPAITEGMTQQLAEIEAIANNPEPATVANTLEALESSGAVLRRAIKVFQNLAGTDSNDAIRAIQSQVAPKLAAHQDAILLNAKLFERVNALYQGRAELDLDPETLRLIEQHYRRFVRAGAQLTEEQKARVRALNEEQASLMTSFQQALLKQTARAAVVVDSEAELDGLSAAEIAAAAQAANAAGHEGKWLLSITNTTRQPVLAQLKNRELRQRVWEASAARGLADGDGDTRKLVLRLAELRAERAALLGKPNHAAYQLEEQMAGTPEAVLSMLRELVPTVLGNVQREADDINALIKAQGGDFTVQPWDWEFYAEQVRAARYDFDPEQVKPYFELNRTLTEGLFYSLNRFYGISFKERSDLPVYNPDVRVFEVLDTDDTSIGLFFFDPFARASKRGGAWMSSFVDQSELLNQKPVIINVLNIAKPVEGEPALLSFDQVTTMFHEIGHGVHGMLSKVRYPSQAGTAVPRDFVEFPSQFNEDWAKEPEVVARYARHYKTGDAVPQELLAKAMKATEFNQGYDTLEYLEATLIDMEWHMLPQGAKVDDVEAFEKAALAKYGVDFAPVPPRYRSTFFSHVFPGGYSSGYYAYLWAEVLAADAFAYVQEQGGLSSEVGARLRNEIISRGGSRDPMKMYVEWRGKQPDPVHLLYRRGLKARAAN